MDGNAEGSVRGIHARDDYTMGKNAVAIGINTEASGLASFAQGTGSIATGEACHAEGRSTRSTHYSSHAEGVHCQAIGDDCHAEGIATTASFAGSHAEGVWTNAPGYGSHAEGYYTVSTGSISHAEGAFSEARTFGCHAEGYGTNANGRYSHTEGYYTSDGSLGGVHIMGRFGTADMPYSWFLGNGTSDSERGLAAKILQDGNAYIDVAWNGGGADYAELFETESGQLIEPGYFVTFAAADKIRIASSGDKFILGVVSRAPGFVAGSGELRWKNKFKTDEWGGIMYEDVTVPEQKDEEGNTLLPAHVVTRPVLNPEFNPSQAYVSRKNRPEWVKVGLLGTLLVRDDGTLTPDGYCRPDMKGVATAAQEGYRVLKRTGPNQAMILFR